MPKRGETDKVNGEFAMFSNFRRPPSHIVDDPEERRRRLEHALAEVEKAILVLERRSGDDAGTTAEALRALRRDLLAALRRSTGH